MKTKELKEQIEFEEFLNLNFEWIKTYSNSSGFDNILIDNDYNDYIVYHCWDNETVIYTYRNKKKKVCECCGSELK